MSVLGCYGKTLYICFTFLLSTEWLSNVSALIKLLVICYTDHRLKGLTGQEVCFTGKRLYMPILAMLPNCLKMTNVQFFDWIGNN